MHSPSEQHNSAGQISLHRSVIFILECTAANLGLVIGCNIRDAIVMARGQTMGD